MIRPLAGLLPALLLSACAQLPFGLGTAPATDQDCGDVLEFRHAAAQLSADAGQAMRQALQPNGRAEDNCNRLRLALLLSKPGTPLRDDAEAAALLAAFLADPATARHPQRALAAQLAEELDERQRLRVRQAALEESLAREKQHARALAKKLEQLQATTATLRQRVKEQQLQLDQLKSIEQDINAKERAVENPAAGGEGGKNP